jgi:hypothetical protein
MMKPAKIGCFTAICLFSSSISLGFSSKAEAVNLISFSDKPPNSSVPIPGIRCFLGACTGGRFNDPVTFSFDSIWNNDQNTRLRVNFSFDVVEQDTFSNDIFRKTFTFDLPSNSTTRVPGFVTLSANQLNSAIERAGSISLEGRRLEFTYENPTFSFRAIPEPSTILGTLAFSFLGVGSLLKRKHRKQKLTSSI